jgi:hypothetical protein
MTDQQRADLCAREGYPARAGPAGYASAEIRDENGSAQLLESVSVTDQKPGFGARNRVSRVQGLAGLRPKTACPVLVQI